MIPKPTNSPAKHTPARHTGRIAARCKPAAGNPDNLAATEQRAHVQHPKRRMPADLNDELYGETSRDEDAAMPASSEARKKLEMLREERLLQQALSDTFDP